MPTTLLPSHPRPATNCSGNRVNHHNESSPQIGFAKVDLLQLRATCFHFIGQGAQAVKKKWERVSFMEAEHLGDTKRRMALF